MTFLALNMNTCFLISQKSDLEFEEMTISNQYNEITQEMGEREQQLSNAKTTTVTTTSTGSTTTTVSTGATSLDNDGELQYLKSQQSYYANKKNSLESQLKVISAELESYQKTVDTNIKNECKLSISA